MLVFKSETTTCAAPFITALGVHQKQKRSQAHIPSQASPVYFREAVFYLHKGKCPEQCFFPTIQTEINFGKHMGQLPQMLARYAVASVLASFPHFMYTCTPDSTSRDTQDQSLAVLTLQSKTIYSSYPENQKHFKKKMYP